LTRHFVKFASNLNKKHENAAILVKIFIGLQLESVHYI